MAAQFYQCLVHEGQFTCNYLCCIEQVSHEDGLAQQKSWEDSRDYWLRGAEAAARGAKAKGGGKSVQSLEFKGNRKT